MAVKGGLEFSPPKKKAVAPAKPRGTRRKNSANGTGQSGGPVHGDSKYLSAFFVLQENWPEFHARLKGAFERGGLSNLAWSFLGREFTRASCCLCAEPTEAVAVRVVYLCSRCELEDVGHGSHLLCDSCGDPWSSSIHYFYCEDHAKPLMED